MSENKESIIKVRDLLIEFGLGKKKVKAVKGVTFDVYKGETFGLVGESGSGKTTVGRAIMGIQPVSDGTIYFNDQVARGEAPNLFKLTKALEKNIERMLDNQNSTTTRLNNYLNEYKRTFYKYVHSKFYDFETKELKEYTDGRSRKIVEGTNIKDTKIINIKKEANIKFVDEAINDNLKRLIKIIRILQKTTTFSKGISKHIDVDERIDIALNENLNETFSLISSIKELENKIHYQLGDMNKIRQDAYDGKYTSVTMFYEDLGTILKNVISDHKSISTLLAMVRKQVKFSIVLTAPNSEKKEYIKYIEEKIKLNEINSNILLTKKYKDILELMNLKSIDESLKKSETFKNPTKKRIKNLKKEMQMIFQDPASSLNDRMPVEEIIGEGLSNFPELYKNENAVNAYVEWYNQNKKDDAKIKSTDVKFKDVKHFLILQLLTTVGMLPEHLSRYPHEFSGGQRQRIGIARALVMKPQFIVADEPISALDVSIRAQVMNLLIKFQKEFDLTYIFIAHDLSVVRFIANRIAVIYRGDIVELADADELFNNPLHPYTKSLLSAVPLPDPEQERKKVHFKYEPDKEHYDYLVNFPYWQEIKPGHFIYANDREIKEIKIKNKIN